MTTSSFCARIPAGIRLVCLWFFGFAAAHADILTVTSTADDPAAPPAGSLRQVIASAANGDTIEFAPTVTGTIALGGAEIAISKNLTITGPGASALAISGNQQSRIFSIAANATVTLSDLTLRDGQAADGGAATPTMDAQQGAPGGAILNAGTLVLERCRFLSNRAGKGGDNVEDYSTASGKGGGDGGAISSTGTLQAIECVFQDNRAGTAGLRSSSQPGGQPGSGGNGGAIYLSGGTAHLEACTISGNRAGDAPAVNGSLGYGGSGGGIMASSTAPTLVNCTISGNQAGMTLGGIGFGVHYGSGGGLALHSGATIVSCTITGNAAGPTNANYPDAGVGGGIRVHGQAFVKFRNTIVADNSVAEKGAGPDVFGYLVSLGRNLVGNKDGATIEPLASPNPPPTHDIIGTRAAPVGAGLLPLADNGGFAPTHALMPGSPAIEAGDDTLGGTDQRGQARPLGAHIDIGAYESDAWNTPVIGFDSSSSDVTEAESQAVVFLVQRRGDTSAALSAQFSTGGGTAIPGQDYTATSGTVNFAVGQTLAGIEVPILNDTVLDGPRTFQIFLSNPTGGAAVSTRGPLYVTIADNDGPGVFAFAAWTTTVSESGGSALVTISRQNGSGGIVSLSYATSGATAAAGADFTATSGTVTFGPGETQQTIAVPIVNDSVFEGTETFTIAISNSTGGATISPGIHTVTIQDDDPPPPQVVAFDATGSHFSEGAQTAFLLVRRTGNLNETVSVSYSTEGLTATAGDDFTLVSGTLVFSTGETQALISVPLVNGETLEGTETLAVTLLNPANGATLGSNTTHTVTIVDDDGPTRFAMAAGSVHVSEAAGTHTATVTRSGNPSAPATVQVRTHSVGAIAGEDFEEVTQSLTFSAWEITKTITVPIINDNVLEDSAYFQLVLSTEDPNAEIVSPGGQTVTILDDDVVIYLDAANATIAEEGGTLNVLIKRQGDATQEVTVQVATSNDTAVASEDYVAVNETVTFASGVSQMNLPVQILNDTVIEPAQSFTVTISPPNNGAMLGAITTATVMITDGDGNLPGGTPIGAGYLGSAYYSWYDYPSEYARLSATTSARGRLSGKLQMMGKTLVLRGSFGEDGSYSQVFPRSRGFVGGTLTLSVSQDTKSLVGTFVTQEANTIEIAASRTKTGTRQEPVAEAKYYTISVGGPHAGSAPGYLCMTINHSGAARLVGRLPDGTTITTSSHVTEAGELPIYLRSYQSRGSLSGPVLVDLGLEANFPVSGQLHWRNPGIPGRPYSESVDGTVDLLGGPYLAPSRGERMLSDFNANGGAAELRVHADDGSAVVTEVPFTWNANNTAAFAANDYRARLSFQPKTGLFSGQFRTTAGKLRRFHGVCVQLEELLSPAALSVFGEETRSVGIVPAD